jgi:hypothetical protein
MGVQMTPVVKRGLSQNCLPSLKIFLQFKRNVAAKIDNVSPRGPPSRRADLTTKAAVWLFGNLTGFDD